MTSFNLSDVSKVLETTNTSNEQQKGISFENQNLKLDSVADAKPLVDAINKCECLEYLNLAGNTLGVEASEAVAKALEIHPEFKRALWKDLFTGRLKDEIPKSLKYLGAGLVKANARLTELDLSDNAFGPIGVEGLASLLSSPSCYQLQELRLNNNGLGIGGGKLLATALLNCYNCSKNNGTPLALRVFIAGRNRLENEGAKALASVFQTIGTLEEIEMPQNGIYHVGITALAQGFEYNPNLKVLNLNDNTIGPKGAASLAVAIQKMSKLKKLNLGDCLLKTKGSILIASALEKLNEIEEVLLDFNEIQIEGGEKLAKILSNKTKLSYLGLDGNMFGSDGVEKVENLLGNAVKVLQPMDGNESPDEDEQNEETDDEEEEEEDADSNEETEDTQEISQEIIKETTVNDFIDCPTADRLLGLGENASKLLLQEAEMEGDDCPTDVYLNTFIPILMKVSALANDTKTEASKQALNCTEILYKRLFEWGKSEEDRFALLNNSLLVHLGLIKSESRKYRPPWNVEGCMKALEIIRTKNFFPKDTNDCLTVIMKNKNNTLSS